MGNTDIEKLCIELKMAGDSAYSCATNIGAISKNLHSSQQLAQSFGYDGSSTATILSGAISTLTQAQTYSNYLKNNINSYISYLKK